MTEIGYFDSYQDGMTESHAVGLFDSNGTLLTSGQVSNSNYLESWFRWTDVADVQLTAGNSYRVMGVSGTEFYAADIDVSSLIIDSRLSYNFYTNSNSGSLVYGAKYTLSPYAFFGASIKITDVPVINENPEPAPEPAPEPVPEPASLLLVGLGLGGLSITRRKAKQQQKETY